MASEKRVVITGIGMVTPLGTNTPESWHSLLAGRSGIQRYDDKTLSLPVGLVTGEKEILNDIICAKDQRRTGRFMHLALIAAHEAIHDAQVHVDHHSLLLNRDRFGTYVGVGIGGMDTIAQAGIDYQARGPRAISPFMLPMTICNEAASWISKTWQLRGPSAAIINACSSGADAIGLAYQAIRHGIADAMLAGGAESCVNHLSLTAFKNMRALSSWSGDAAQASRPFDKDRSGFVMSEGAGMLVLETLESAQERKDVTIYAEVVGYGATADAYHITAMHPEGDGAQRAMQEALRQANIKPHQVGYINAHGTGTVMNDAIETKAIKSVFGSHALPVTELPTIESHLLVSSTKSMTGHMLGAAGGVEIGYTALALESLLAPPTINRTTPDPACDLDYVTQGKQAFVSDYALSNSFSFGGGNTAVLLKRWKQ